MRQTSLPPRFAPTEREPSRAYGFVGQSQPVPGPFRADGLPVPSTVGFDAAAPVTFFTSTFFVGTAAQKMLGFNPKRRYLALQNNGAVDIWVHFGGDASINGSMKLPVNGVWTFDGGYAAINDVSVIASAGCLLSVTEGTLSV